MLRGLVKCKETRSPGDSDIWGLGRSKGLGEVLVILWQILLVVMYRQDLTGMEENIHLGWYRVRGGSEATRTVSTTRIWVDELRRKERRNRPSAKRQNKIK